MIATGGEGEEGEKVNLEDLPIARELNLGRLGRNFDQGKCDNTF